ncbi:MAG: prepilin-type N-terminal cleavage/methylation domain-containing protein [Magnetococcales bacterium]|nr:prepilin-type N-terminal cleavage/methylation domain-containing protein [Magnetococcales bacterium]
MRSIRNKREGGFSLIELAIVLVIIGLIISAVTIGKDTMRSAELNKLWTGLVSPYIQSSYGYYAKIGKMPDCTAGTDCTTAFLKLGLYGKVTADESMTYNKADGATATVSLTSIKPKTANPRHLELVFGDTDTTNNEGLNAIIGYTGGVIATNAITITLTQFAADYSANL